MKFFVTTVILWSLVLVPAFAHSDALTRLKSLKLEAVKTVTEETKLSDTDMKAQDEVFEALESAVQDQLKKPNPDLYKEILRVTVEMLKKDPTQFAGEVVLPLYKKNKKVFVDSLFELSPSDARLVEDAVKMADREKRQGNG